MRFKNIERIDPWLNLAFGRTLFLRELLEEEYDKKMGVNNLKIKQS